MLQRCFCVITLLLGPQSSWPPFSSWAFYPRLTVLDLASGFQLLSPLLFSWGPCLCLTLGNEIALVSSGLPGPGCIPALGTEPALALPGPPCLILSACLFPAQCIEPALALPTLPCPGPPAIGRLQNTLMHTDTIGTSFNP